MINKFFYGKNWYENMFLYLLYFSWILYIIVLLGITTKAPDYLSSLQNVLKIYIALFLIIKFNIYNKDDQMSKFDKRIAFSAGVFLLLTTTITNIVEKYISEIQALLSN